jgi:lysophospholipase L1-like esterase
MRYAVLLVGLLTLVSACGSSDNPEPSPSPSASRDDTAAPRASRTSIPVPHLQVIPSDEGHIGTAPLYLALGDSLSAGVGATGFSAEKAFVGLVHDELGPEFALLNLGIAGHDSHELIEEGPLDRAVGEIEQRNRDDDPDNDVEVVTLEIGGNDLLDLFFDLVLPGRCPSVAEGLQTPECVEALRGTLDAYEPNLDLILDRLREADPELNIFLMTLYNPFSGALPVLDELGELTLEGDPETPFPDGLQDIIRRQAEENDVHLVEVYPLFEGKAREYIAADTIHPNDTGYRVMADAVLAEMREAGVID